MNNPPKFRGFTPIGATDADKPVLMAFEEYEAIRLSDSELLSQTQAAASMGISRPTFTRIYESARRKVALAFTEARTIVFEGGKVYFDSDWFHCRQCGCWFSHPHKDKKLETCALCGSIEFSPSDNTPCREDNA